MESTWYLFPGQTFENTKISDRSRALHVSSKAWSGITAHLDRKRIIQENMEREKAHKKALKDGSEAMTSQWENSIQNIYLRKEEAREERLNQKKQDKLALFYKMRDEQEVVRKEYVEKMRREIFMTKGYPKELNSALITSATLHERGKQQEFDEIIKKHNAEEDGKYVEKIRRDAEMERKEKLEEKIQEKRKQKEYGIVLKEQVLRRETENSEMIRKRTEKEIIDNIKADEEMVIIKKMEEDEKRQKRLAATLEKKKNLEEERERQRIIKQEEKEMEDVTQIYAEAKRRIDCMRKAKEKELHDAAVERRIEIAKKVAAIQKAKDEGLEERIRAAEEEKDAADAAKILERAKKDERNRLERIEDRKQYLKRLEQEKQIEEEVKKWEMLNRSKANEAMEQYDKQQEKERWAKMLEYRKVLLDQIAEEKDEREQLKELEKLLARISYEKDDEMFFKYADEVLEVAKDKGLQTFPIEKVIESYKKENGLAEKPIRRCRHMKC